MNVGFVGMGNMGQMLVTALAGSGALEPDSIWVSNRSPEKLDRIAARVPGLHIAVGNGELAQRCRTIFLCIKPGETAAVLQQIGPYISDDHLLICITNTIEIANLERRVAARVAKVIPAVVQAVGAGVSLFIFGGRCTSEDRSFLNALFSTISHPYEIRESQARVASDLTSCGPAFLCHVFRALARAARHCQPDLPADSVDAMIRHTAEATLRLLSGMDYSFDDVLTRVSTPGGITTEGLKVLETRTNGLWEAVIETTIVKEDEKKSRVQL